VGAVLTVNAFRSRRLRPRRIAFLGLLAVAVAALAPARGLAASPSGVRVLTIDYRAHDGARRRAYVVVPASYFAGPRPRIPLVISPHGRGGEGRTNAKLWGDLPALGNFAVVNPDGMGRRLARFSFGYPGQIDDLARMPDIVSRALPWLHVDRKHVFALGSSMGGQETLLLVARHPRLLAGAAAMDSVTDLARRYRQLPALGCDAACLERFGRPYGELLQASLAQEVGGSPTSDPRAYAERSPFSLAQEIASSGVPLQIWWSRTDRIVFDQEHQSRALFLRLHRLNPCAAVSAYVGRWRHSVEMKPHSLLPFALARFGLLPGRFEHLPKTVAYFPSRPSQECKVTDV
jgi:pimeloyl-ACP methyl ester carboxylesterase